MRRPKPPRLCRLYCRSTRHRTEQEFHRVGGQAVCNASVGLDVEVAGMHDCFGFFKAFFSVDAVTSHLVAIELVVQFSQPLGL